MVALPRRSISVRVVMSRFGLCKGRGRGTQQAPVTENIISAAVPFVMVLTLTRLSPTSCGTAVSSHKEPRVVPRYEVGQPLRSFSMDAITCSVVWAV